jgi:hypothetical protein
VGKSDWENSPGWRAHRLTKMIRWGLAWRGTVTSLEMFLGQPLIPQAGQLSHSPSSSILSPSVELTAVPARQEMPLKDALVPGT